MWEMEIREKLPCEFGAKCYRRNPKHFESYSHPKELITKRDYGSKNSNTKAEGTGEKMKQTTLHVLKKDDSLQELQSLTQNKLKEKNERGGRVFGHKRKFENNDILKKKISRIPKVDTEKLDRPPDKLNAHFMLKYIKSEKRRKAGCFPSSSKKDENSIEFSEESTSWVFIKKPSVETETSTDFKSFNDKTPEEIIRFLFLVDMPPDFYNFFEFCKTIEEGNPDKALLLCQMKLVGPFDVLSGKIKCPVKKESGLCHWRFYYDPPEFQTVLVSELGFHLGYWRDGPKEEPCFLASNNPDKGCVFKIEAENIFGAVFRYINQSMKSCDPFKKLKLTKLQKSLSEWAEKNNFPLDKNTSKIRERQKKVVSKTFHKAGIVVPVNAKTELGYRPLIESEENLKRICNLIIESDDSDRESLWENLQPLINAANIANDECDFGNSLELGMDLFCMGSSLFHNTIEHLLSTAYSLLKRTEFEIIIKAHLNFRRKGQNLSAFN